MRRPTGEVPFYLVSPDMCAREPAPQKKVNMCFTPEQKEDDVQTRPDRSLRP